VLDALRTNLKTCAVDSRHVHRGDLRDCVWCTLQRRHVSPFGEAPEVDVGRDTSPRLDLEAMEREVDAARLDEPWRVPELPVPPSKALVAMEEWKYLVLAVPFVAIFALMLIERMVSPRIAGVMIAIALLMIAVIWLQRFFSTAAASDYAYAQRQFEQTRGQLRKLSNAMNAANGSAAVAAWRNKVDALREFEQGEVAAMAKFKRKQPKANARAWAAFHRERGARRRKLEGSVTAAFAKIRRAAANPQSVTDDQRRDFDRLRHELNERYKRLIEIAARLP
jgi:DNA-binding helix-hairpin-helix protein with protein kinase domain